MLNDFTPYLTFNGNCEEALNFYKKALNGEIVSLMPFSQGPKEMANVKGVLHATFKFGDCKLMASDGMPDQPVKGGSNLSLSINCTDAAEMEKAFNNLAEGGHITMPLQDTFWGARFGMLTDKFGFNWMFNHELKK